MILVTGASGKTGRAVVRALAESGQQVRALIHKPEQAEMLKALGAVETFVGEMLSENSMLEAARNVQGMYHICPNVNSDEIIIGAFAIKAAHFSRVDHFVFHSVIHPQTEAMPHHWKKLRVEELLLESGLDFTILQPAPYMQNILAYWSQITQERRYPIPYPVQTRLSMLDLDDLAAVAALVLTEPEKHRNAIYELAGTPPISQEEVAEVLSKFLGFKVQAEEVPLEAWENRARANRMDAYALDTLLSMFSYYARFGMSANSNLLTCLLGRQPTSLPQFVQRTLKTLPL